MDLTQLRTFVAVAQEGHLTRAAERLHISQPAASAHIRALESDFGLKLFTRSNRGLDLTLAGRRLAEAAGRLLGSAVELAALARELHGGEAGRFSLGTNSDPVLNRLKPLMSWLSRTHPLVELNVEIRSSLATCEGVRAGELNAGFMLGSKFQKGLEGLLLGKLEFCIAAPAAWADAVRNANLKDLASLPWIVTAPGTPSYEMREEIFRREGLYVNSAIEVNNVVLVHEFVQAGLGLGLIRRDRAELGVAQGLFVLSRVASVSTNLLFVHPAEQQSDPILHAVLEGVHIVWQDVLGANRPLRVLA